MEYLQAKIGMKVRPTKLASKGFKECYDKNGAFTIVEIADKLSQTIYCILGDLDDRKYPFRPREITSVED